MPRVAIRIIRKDPLRLRLRLRTEQTEDAMGQLPVHLLSKEHNLSKYFLLYQVQFIENTFLLGV